MLFIYNLFVFNASYFVLNYIYIYNLLMFSYEDLTFVIVSSLTFVRSSLILKGIMLHWTKGINI
jgi:hypothetical protein